MDNQESTIVEIIASEVHNIELSADTLLQGGRYRIIKSIGQGGFGITYLAEQTMAGRKVCIKEFFPSEYYNRDINTNRVSLGSQGSAEVMNRYKEKFVKEARTLAALNHPHIIPVYDVFEENNTAYYVMEYIDGESLSEIVRRDGAIEESRALRYIKDVASALGYLHNRQTTHLDVKPSNIMVRRDDDRAILIDFGLSKHYDDNGKQTTSTPGGISHGYAPTEMYDGNGAESFSPCIDIYSLGATLYHLVVGVVPPRASEIINNGVGTLPTKLSRATRNTIERAMQPSASQRPQSIAAFLQLLDSRGGGKPTESHKRSWWRWLPFLVVVLLGIVAFAIVSSSKDKPIPSRTEKVNKVVEHSVKTEAKVDKTTETNFVESVNGISFNMIWVDGGTFAMGSPDGVGEDNEHPQHQVTLDGYWIAETEVTQALWTAVMGTTVEQQRDKIDKSSSLKGTSDNYPMYYVSYEEALDFCKELNALTGNKYNFTLPTEAQWEFAARGGNKSNDFKYSGSTSIDKVAWYEGNSGADTHPVKGKAPNELGLYDMSGNVWEWCLDWYSSSYYSNSPSKNPQGPSSGSERVLRGGSWGYGKLGCLVTNRISNSPSPSSRFSNFFFSNFGFRVVALSK